jgi:hypothetical protein
MSANITRLFYFSAGKVACNQRVRADARGSSAANDNVNGLDVGVVPVSTVAFVTKQRA